jgi:hypothetical protein
VDDPPDGAPLPPPAKLPSAKCADCPSWALTDGVEPDGMRRCLGHSKRPECIARREACGAHGRAAGERQKGVARELKQAAARKVIDISEARKEKVRKPDPEAKPIPLGTKAQAQAFLEKAAGQLIAGGDPQTANAAANVVRSALAIIAADEPPAPEQEVIGFNVRRVDRHTKVEQKPPSQVVN